MPALHVSPLAQSEVVVQLSLHVLGGNGVAVGPGVSVAVGPGVSVAVGSGVAVADGPGVTVGEGPGVGLNVGVGEIAWVGVTVGAQIQVVVLLVQLGLTHRFCPATLSQVKVIPVWLPQSASVVQVSPQA